MAQPKVWRLDVFEWDEPEMERKKLEKHTYVRKPVSQRRGFLRLNGLENESDKGTGGEALKSFVVFKCDQWQVKQTGLQGKETEDTGKSQR